MMPDPEVGLQRLLKGLDRLELQCMVAGSLASSLHGIWRATNDVDLVVRLTSDRVDEFVAEFSPEYYIDADQVSGALRLGRPFNMIYLASA